MRVVKATCVALGVVAICVAATAALLGVLPNSVLFLLAGLGGLALIGRRRA